MCYAKPGPRCTTHVRRDLAKAVRKARQEPTAENLTKVQFFKDALDGTAGGQYDLKQKIEYLDEVIIQAQAQELEGTASTAALERDTLQHRLENGIADHENKMRAYRQARAEANASVTSATTTRPRATRAARSTRSAPAQARSPLTLPAPGSLMVQQTPQSAPTYSKQQQSPRFVIPDAMRYPSSDYIDHDDLGIYSYNPGCAGCTGNYDDYCRCRTYSTANFEVDTRKVLASAFSCRDSDIPGETIQWAQENGFDDEEAYRIRIEGDWYGENIDVSLTGESMRKLQEYYQKHTADTWG